MQNNNNSISAIRINNIKVGFGKESDQPCILNDFSYDFQKGKIYGIIGNSGVGKTTLISYFNGLNRSKYGNVQIGKYCIVGNKKRIRNYKKIRKEASLLFQNAQHQLFNSTVLKDVTFGPKNFGISKIDVNALARAYLKKMAIKQDMLDESPFVLSNGQQKRVALAGVLAIEPSVFLFDEPTVGLDPSGVRLVTNIIKDLKKENKTIIVVSHNMDLILEICDEVILMHNQKILVSGKPYEVFCSPLLTHTHIVKPAVISLVEKLATSNEKFKMVFASCPTNQQQLLAILKPLVRSKEKK